MPPPWGQGGEGPSFQLEVGCCQCNSKGGHHTCGAQGNEPAHLHGLVAWSPLIFRPGLGRPWRQPTECKDRNVPGTGHAVEAAPPGGPGREQPPSAGFWCDCPGPQTHQWRWATWRPLSSGQHRQAESLWLVLLELVSWAGLGSPRWGWGPSHPPPHTHCSGTELTHRTPGAS